MKKPQIECLESPSMPLSSHNRGGGAILATFLAVLSALVCSTARAEVITIPDDVTPDNLVTNVGGSASSDTKCLNSNSYYGVAKAFDKKYYNDDTRWIGHGSTFPQRAVWTFPVATVVDTVRIYNANAKGLEQSPTVFTVAGSNDGDSWTELDSESGVEWTGVKQFKTFGFANVTAYLKYRLEVTQVKDMTSSNGKRLTITEIELYRLNESTFAVSAETPTPGTDSFSVDWTLSAGDGVTAEAGLVLSADETFATATTNSLGTALSAGTYTAVASGLEPDTTYWWKIYADNGSGTLETAAKSVTTTGAPVLGTATATVDGETASFSVALATAAMENTLATSVSVFYGTDGETWTELPLGSASEAQTFSGTVQSLGYGVTCQWYAQATATLAGGRVLSAQTDIASFTTLYNGDMYVDAAAQNATAPYSTTATAAPDIATALALAADGATIHVAPGLYPSQTELSIDGAIQIIGQGDTVSSVVVSNAHESGYARQNQRVFVINNADALIANLTMQKGEGYSNQDGGNFYIGTAGGMVSNCIVEAGSVRDNARAAGGWLEAGLVTHTIFRGNKSKTESGNYADNRAGVLQLKGSARAENCLFTENSQDKAVTLINVSDTSVMRNCTIVNSGLQVTNAYCKAWSALNIGSDATVQNVVVAGVTNTVDGAAVLPTGSVAKFANGAVDGDISELAFPEGTITSTAASFFKDYANGDYTPAKPLVNKGANYEGMASVDLAGNPRKIGSKIDIGCYEASSSALMIVVR